MLSLQEDMDLWRRHSSTPYTWSRKSVPLSVLELASSKTKETTTMKREHCNNSCMLSLKLALFLLKSRDWQVQEKSSMQIHQSGTFSLMS